MKWIDATQETDVEEEKIMKSTDLNEFLTEVITFGEILRENENVSIIGYNKSIMGNGKVSWDIIAVPKQWVEVRQ